MDLRFVFCSLAALLLGCRDIGQQARDAALRTRLPSPLCASPNENSLILLEMEAGEALTDLGETGPSETMLALAGERVQSPWVKVRTVGGAEGWALAWALQPKGDASAWLLSKRAECYFGKPLASRCAALRDGFSMAHDEQSLAARWAEAALLRDTMTGLLSQMPLTATDLHFGWLAELLPAFVAQRHGQRAIPKWFADYGEWANVAARTAGAQDDVFFGICSAFFPHDSIESDFPLWKFPLSESESASQLGAGQHATAFRLIDRGMAEAPLFRPFLEAWKERLLADIFGPQVAYWRSKDSILKEMEALLKTPPKCLDVKEIGALAIRKKMFESSVENGIKLNLRSGETGL